MSRGHRKGSDPGKPSRGSTRAAGVPSGEGKRAGADQRGGGDKRAGSDQRGGGDKGGSGDKRGGGDVRAGGGTRATAGVRGSADPRASGGVRAVAGAGATGRSQRYIAFLRAINVGGHTVRMDQLRALFEALDFGGVATFIASGNVIFDADTDDESVLTDRIERHLARELGYDVATFLRTPAELAAIAQYDVFPASTRPGENHTLYVAFLKQPPAAAAVRQLTTYSNDTDQLHVRGREAYWLTRTNLSGSTFSGALLEKTVGRATIRNVTTVRKLAAKYPEPE